MSGTRRLDPMEGKRIIAKLESGLAAAAMPIAERLFRKHASVSARHRWLGDNPEKGEVS
jgi:hypothetical protein